MAGPEWELSKENVAPVTSGRDVKVLSKALKTSKAKREAQRCIFEREVRDALAGHGPHKDDPLEAWTRYTKWIVENFPEGSDTLTRAVEEVCRMYAKNERYRDDIRLVRLWIRYIDLRSDKLDAFNYMNRRRIGESWSLFYEAWAITLEIARQYDDAERVYRTGRERQAKPVERLALREREYYSRMAARRRRDDKRKREAEKKRLCESQRDEARRGRNSSRADSSLANAILSQPDIDEKSIKHGTSAVRVRPALGRINESQAISGHRPFVLERRQRRLGSLTHVSSQNCKKGHALKPKKFEIHADVGVTSSPTEPIPKQTKDDVPSIPALPKRDEVRKEDDGQLPSKWAGETLRQEESLKRKLQKGTNPLFEVYKDPEVESLSRSEVREAIAKDISRHPTVDNALERSKNIGTASPNATSLPWTQNIMNSVLEVSGSPTINTKLAMREVEEAFNSSLPMGEKSESIELGKQSLRSVPVKTPEVQRVNTYEVPFFEKEKHKCSESPDRSFTGDKRIFLPASEQGALPGYRVRDSSREGILCVAKSSLEASQTLLETGTYSVDLQRTYECDMTEFLASWCNNDPDFQLLEESDPKVVADGMFDVQCRQGIVSFNVDKYQWAGYRLHSFVVLADDLNNSFELLNTSEEVASDEDDFKVVAVKVSQSSNAWEYYIYKTIHSRLSKTPASIPQAIAFCEGNPKSYLILDSYSNCSLREALSLCDEKKLPESLALFFTVSILKILETLHAIGVIHSDVTLDNLLFRNDLAADISRYQYSPNGEGGWSRWGVFLIDYNHAIDAGHPQIRHWDVKSLSLYATKQGNSFLSEEYRLPSAARWAYNADCFCASVCAAKMLGVYGSDSFCLLSDLQYSSVWENFFVTMQGLQASSTAHHTSEAMRLCRLEMESILKTDKMLAVSLMQLTTNAIDAHNEDMTTGF